MRIRTCEGVCQCVRGGCLYVLPCVRVCVRVCVSVLFKFPVFPQVSTFTEPNTSTCSTLPIVHGQFTGYNILGNLRSLRSYRQMAGRVDNRTKHGEPYYKVDIHVNCSLIQSKSIDYRKRL